MPRSSIALPMLMLLAALAGGIASAAEPAHKVRARDLGVPFDGTPGPLNAITDVAGVRVGHATVIADTPHAVRSGVTAVWPRGPEIWDNFVFAGGACGKGGGQG